MNSSLSDEDRAYIAKRLAGPVARDCSPIPIAWRGPNVAKWTMNDVKALQAADDSRIEKIRAAYYAGGFRVIRDGMPTRVVHKHPARSKADEVKRFAETTYSNTCVVSGWQAEPGPLNKSGQRDWGTSAEALEKRESFFIMRKGKIAYNAPYATKAEAEAALGVTAKPVQVAELPEPVQVEPVAEPVAKPARRVPFSDMPGAWAA